MPDLWPYASVYFRTSYSTGSVPPTCEANGMSWMCLCGQLIPDSFPLLKNIKDWRLFKATAAAYQSFLHSGVSCFTKSLVMTSVCSLLMGNLLKRRRWVSDRSAIKRPGSNGGMNGSKSFFFSLLSASVGFFANPSIKRTSNGIPPSSTVSAVVPRNTMSEFGSNYCATRLLSASL